jgi:hypothetical protein
MSWPRPIDGEDHLLMGQITEDYQLIAAGGAAGGSEQWLDEKPRVGQGAVIKYVLGAACRSARCY